MQSAEGFEVFDGQAREVAAMRAPGVEEDALALERDGVSDEAATGA